MDIIIIGKPTHNRTEPPTVVYCGTDRNAAQAAIDGASDKLVRFYELNPEPYRPAQRRKIPASASSAAPDLEPAATSQKKKEPKN